METEVLEKTNITKEIDQSEKTEKKSLLDYAKEFKKRPVIRVLDETLVYGNNMWPKLMKEEVCSRQTHLYL